MRVISILFLFFALFGCGNHSQNFLKLYFEFPDATNDTVSIYYYNPVAFAKDGIHELVLYAEGCGDIQLDWGRYVFARADIGGQSIAVFTSPRGEMKVSGSSTDLPGLIRYSGTGAVANDYISELNRIYSEHENWDGQYYGSIDSAAFQQHKAKIQSQIEAINTEALEIAENSDTLIKLLELETEYRSLAQALNYELFSKKYMGPDELIMLENQSFLNSHSVYHQIALDIFLHRKVFGPVWARYETREMDSVSYIFPQLAYEEIMSLETSFEHKEFFSSRLIYNYLSAAELSPSVDTIYKYWQDTFPDSEYAPLLEREYNSILTLESGIGAPEIHGITPEGDSLLLSDLKGKVVYIKVWATWCGPCLGSFPDWELLQQEYEDRDEVVFLSVSIDSEKDKWREMVEKRQLSGVNIHTDSEKLREDYMIPGIPRYILIDQKGVLVDANAPRPHEEGIKDRIFELL